jgi:phage terminase large subunit-like protein
MMQVQSEDDSIWTRRHIKEFEGTFLHEAEQGISFLTLEDGSVKPVNVFAGVDPATDSQRRDADFSVIMVIAVDEDNNLYVLDYTKKRGIPVLGIPGEPTKGIVDYMFEMNNIYHPNLFTIEDTSMSKPVMQSLISEMKRRNDFGVKFKAEKPGTRMSKRDRIQEVLSARFSTGQIHLKRDDYDLRQEILTFGPRMAHDDCIDALAYAAKYSYPLKGINEEKGKYTKRKPQAKSWVVA